tara:strand:- start:387 stop:797 length:411 start_codon:yes stop_codon:yes gene_type:complete
MCSGGGGTRRAPKKKQSEFKDAPPTVTGRQTGVANPKDTKRATESLKMKRREREGINQTPEAVTTFANLMIPRQSNKPKGGGGGKLNTRKGIKEVFAPPKKQAPFPIKVASAAATAAGNRRTRKNIREVFAINRRY